MSWSRDFPNLNEHNHRITSPATPNYNCVAWAAEDVEHWWQPGHYWLPSDWPDDDFGLGALERAFRERGYACVRHFRARGWLSQGRTLRNFLRLYTRRPSAFDWQVDQLNGNFRKAVEFIRSGRIGPVRTIRIGVGAPSEPCNLPEETAPEGTDWELWNGPSPARAYNHELCPNTIHTHFPIFRRFREYANGMLGDMGAHHFDIAQWALDMDGSAPTEIHPPETANTGLRFVYASGVEMFHGGNVDCRFEGTDGRVIEAGRAYLRSTPAEIVQTPLGERDFRLPEVGNSHRQNWINCIRSRQRPVADVAIGARTAQVCQLANIAYQLRRSLRWNPEREEFVNDAEANRLRSRENRTPWDRI